MPRRSAITELPNNIKDELDERLVSGGFARYQDLAEWLAGEGYEISRSAIHRYGHKFKFRLEAMKHVTEQSRIIAEHIGDDANLVGDALTRLIQEKLFGIVVDLEDPGEMSLPALVRAIADLNRSSVTVKKYSAEVREKLRVKLSALEAENKQDGKLDPETLRRVREEIYGIF